MLPIFVPLLSTLDSLWWFFHQSRCLKTRVWLAFNSGGMRRSKPLFFRMSVLLSENKASALVTSWHMMIKWSWAIMTRRILSSVSKKALGRDSLFEKEGRSLVGRTLILMVIWVLVSVEWPTPLTLGSLGISDLHSPPFEGVRGDPFQLPSLISTH